MKAKEAPEKIYISHHTVSDSMGEPVEEFWEDWFEEKEVETDIEYIRADAFIEKACAWLKTHSEVDYFELIPDANYCGAGNLNKKRMVEDFEEYLKK